MLAERLQPQADSNARGKRGLGLGGDVGIGVRQRRVPMLDAFEQEGGRLPGRDGDPRADIAAVDDLERHRVARLSSSSGNRKRAPCGMSA